MLSSSKGNAGSDRRCVGMCQGVPRSVRSSRSARSEMSAEECQGVPRTSEDYQGVPRTAKECKIVKKKCQDAMESIEEY